MNLKIAIVCVLVLGLWVLAGKAQCPDFMDLTSSSVTGYYGFIGDTVPNVGIVPLRHTLITQQGMDSKTGGQLPLLPNGENAVIKLGNEQVGAQTESLVYTFTVDPDYPVLLLKYAVVMEDPHHLEIEQPHFLIQMLDANGELLNGCMEYNVISSPTIPGFQAFNHVMWRPWTTNGFDLSEYAGQTVKFQISTFDCSAGAHYGYAYFTASCISNKLTITGCNGQQVTITAPSGFESYSWNNGSHASSTTYTIQGNTVATCVITTVTGCQILESVTFTQDTIPQDYVFYDTICEGMDYHNHGFNLPVYSTPGDYVIANTYYNATDCIEEGVNTLYLHVRPRYYHIYDVACEGESYNAYGFQYSQLTQGTFTDTNQVPLSYGCDSVTILHLTVNHIFSMSETINGPHVICSGSLDTFFLPNAPSPASTNYYWAAPDGVIVYIGQGTPNAQLYFTQNAPSSVQITLTADNGCGTATLPFDITVGSSYSNMFSDTICTGSPYTEHGYQLSAQDTAGYYVHVLNGTTQQGCDSVSILQLLVVETPSVDALADPEIICVGSETNLYAVGSQASVTLPSQMLSIAIGDILCTDNTIVNPQNWPCGKVALGIVFHVDATGLHGWAVSLNDISPCSWGTTVEDIPALTNYASSLSTLENIDGYQNTANIRAAGNATQFPAAYAVDFDHGWYLPSAAQLSLIYAQLPFIQAALTAAGGTPMQTAHSTTVYSWQDIYWTSTESSGTQAWIIPFTEDAGAFVSWSYYTGTPMQINKNMSARVRAVCSFPPPENENIYDTTLTYNWNTASTEPHFSDVPLQTTSYTVTVSNAYGCTNSASVDVIVISNEPQTYYDTICQGAPYNSYGFVLTAEETAGILDTTFTQTVSAAGCESEVTVYLTLLPPDVVEIEEHAGQSFVWNGVTYTQDGTYTQHFNNIHGCDSTVILTLTLDGGVDPGTDTISEETAVQELYLPNAFTPNDDGKNTVFLPVFTNPEEIEQYRMEIYNRWGTLVFRTEEKTFGWDGSNAMDGVYAVVVHYKSRGAKPKTVTGSVTVVR